MALLSSSGKALVWNRGEKDEISQFASEVNRSGKGRKLGECKRIHAEILESSHHLNRYLGNLLVEMYGKCGSVDDARKVFEELHKPNLFSWNIMLKVYVDNGRGRDALEFYNQQMSNGGKSKGVEPNAVTFVTLVEACSSLMELRQMHGHIAARGLDSDVIVGSALLDRYAKCGSLVGARAVFDRLCHPNVISWTTLVGAYAQKGLVEDAKQLFEQMPERNVVSWNTMITALTRKGLIEEAISMYRSMSNPDVISATCMIVAFGQKGDLEQARLIFNEMPERNVTCWNAMVAAYGQSGRLKEARNLFDRMPVRDAVSWTTMISAYAQNGCLVKCKMLFDRLEKADVYTWNTILAAHMQFGKLEEVKKIFDELEKKDVISWNTMLSAYAHNGEVGEARTLFEVMPEKDVASWNTMVKMYAQNEKMEEASGIFLKMPHGIRNLVTWNCMAVGYAECGNIERAIDMIGGMDIEGVSVGKETIITVVDACAGIAAAGEAKVVHKSIVDAGFVIDVALGACLINMYSKCGSMDDAVNVFDSAEEMLRQVHLQENGEEMLDVMLTAYSQNGLVKHSIEVVRQMDMEGLRVNERSMMRILSACSRAGLVADACYYFISTIEDYDICVKDTHYLCMIDVLGRAGRLDEAEELVKNMPFEPHAVAWTMLVAACIVHGDFKRGLACAHHALESRPESSAPYILISQLFSIS